MVRKAVLAGVSWVRKRKKRRKKVLFWSRYKPWYKVSPTPLTQEERTRHRIAEYPYKHIPFIASKGQYHVVTGRDRKQQSIHRACWEAHYPLHKGFHVHHIDGNTTNNEIWNLAALAPGIHRTVHAEEARRALEAYRAQ